MKYKASNVLPDLQTLINEIKYPKEIVGEVKHGLIKVENNLRDVITNANDINLKIIEEDEFAKSFLPDVLFGDKQNIFVPRYVYY